VKPELQDLYDKNLADFGHLDPDQIAGLTIYAEARGETREGRIAVGTVILERVDHRSWDGKTIEEVCLWPYQFSCFLPNDRNRDMLKQIADEWDRHYSQSRPLQECYSTARGLIDGTIPRDPELAAGHCCQYMTAAASKVATWDDNMKLIKKIGGHCFYA